MRVPSEKRPITIAIVEDDFWNQQSLKAILEQDDELLCTGTFASAEEALAKLPELKPNVILMDVVLPGMNGVECVRKLAAKVPNALIIMHTVREEAGILFDSFAAGASGYLLKTSSAAELLGAIHNAFNGGAPMTDSIARKVVQSFARPRSRGQGTENLTQREGEVLEMLATGRTYKEMAALLKISYSTVHRHLEHIYDKLHVHSRTEAVTKYLRS